MKRIAVFSFLLILVVSSLTFAADQPADPQEMEHYYPCTVLDRDVREDGMTLTLQILEPEWVPLEGEDNALIPEYVTGGAIQEPGYPEVPTLGRLFRLPPQSGVVIEVIDSEFELIENIDFPIFNGDQELDDGIPFAPVDEWFPADLAEVGSPALFHDFRVANLITHPVQVNTARREARIYSRIQVDISFEGVDDRNTLEYWPTEISKTFVPWYRMMFMDWNDNELDEYTLYQGSVLVVVKEDLLNNDHFQPWIEWKLQRGWELDFITDDDINFSNTNIRNELRARYAAAEHKPDYVVVCGDDQGPWSVPASESGNGAGDQQYATLLGNDNLADVGVGRISVQNNTQLQTVVNKIISYERDVDFDNTDWYRKGVLTRSDTHAGISKVILLRYMLHGLQNIGYTEVDTSWAGPAANQVAINAINEGVSFYSQRGYINSGLNGNQINGLNNDFMTPVVIDVTCGTGNWSGGTGTNEYYLLAGTPNVPRGGVGAFGMATAGTNPKFNNPAAAGSAQAFFGTRLPTMGDMSLGGRVNLWMNFNGRDNGSMNNFLRWYNLMGDPIAYVWTGIPLVLDVTSAGEMEIGQNNYDVLVEDTDGQPVADAMVTFYKYTNNDEILVRGQTDADGMLSLDASPGHTGTAIVTVGKQHYAPYQVEIDVVNPDARVGYTDIDFLDNGTRGTVGNGNGVPEAGETVGLTITARNFGNDTETNVVATVTADDPWIVSLTGTIDYGTLDADDSSDGDGLILVEIAPEAQHDWIEHFDIEFSTDTNTYEDSFPITIQAVQLAMVTVNGIGNLEPGGEANISIRVKNVGGSNATSSNIFLNTELDPFLGSPSRTEPSVRSMSGRRELLQQ